MITRITKSFESICHNPATEAPNTLRMPISFVRCSATNDARPNKPRQEMKMARIAKYIANLPMRSSFPNFLSYSSSTNEDVNGEAGLYFLNTSSIFASDFLALHDGFIFNMKTFCDSFET